MFHLSLRVAWHDAKWNGAVCQKPSANSYCVTLDRIREERDEQAEDALAGRNWNELKPAELPPCKAESGVFMNSRGWTRRFVHPYSDLPKAKGTHGHLKPTSVKVPEYATFAVPFNWMLRGEQKGIDHMLPEPLPPDERSPFNSPWVFGHDRQKALLDLFFGRLAPGRSIAFFYCKEGHPLGECIPRLVVGAGRISSVQPAKEYDVDGDKPTYLMWDLLVRHTIRPDGYDGFLLPYHEYLEPTGDPDEDSRRQLLLREIIVQADPAHMRAFSYAAELVPADIGLSTLVRCLEAVRKVREHGIAAGPWAKREEWLNAQIAEAWKDRGPFPGMGVALEAVGLRLGTAMVLELLASGRIKREEDPWSLVDAILGGSAPPPQSAYVADIRAMHATWKNLPEERKALLKLLSRFALTRDQAVRWFDPAKRGRGTSAKVEDVEILSNPYRISEVDLGEWKDLPVSIGVIDRGLMPDSSIAVAHPIPGPSRVDSPQDSRRIRAAIVAVLRDAAADGDTLLSVTETLQRVSKLDLAHDCIIGHDWPGTNRYSLADVVETIEVITDEKGEQVTPSLQLREIKDREEYLRNVLSKRAAKEIKVPDVDWKSLLIEAISSTGRGFNPQNPRHLEAIAEQAAALGRILGRKLSVLTGRAGTGKTSVLGAFMLCQPIIKDGILLLAPTGKARVRLGSAANAEAMTVAQFLHRLKRYDGSRQRPLFHGEEMYRKEKTVVIDECSMLTMDDLTAVLKALDLAHVQRVILVGDPNQLPPIGVGRPFADLIAFLENTKDTTGSGSLFGQAMARLSVEVRTTPDKSESSDTLRLASWFTREPQPVDADRVLSDLEMGAGFNDLQLVFWKTPDEFRERLREAFCKHLGMEHGADVFGFDRSLGFDERGWVPFDAPQGAENWQILSPVRMHPHGIKEINRWVQRQFRSKELDTAINSWGTSLGDENIVVKDKVIQLSNQWRDAYDGEESEEHYIANGEVGLVANGKSGFLNVLFAGRPNLRFGYRGSDFPGGSGPLELAYALTVHKSQGSEFRKIFVVIPKNCRLLSRELLYTALTRSKEQLVLLIEGDDPTILFDMTRPERSETARRNTNLFHGTVRAGGDAAPFAEHLIHKTLKGHMVRSKSELVIANLLFKEGMEYQYERILEGGVAAGGKLRPDFSFVTAEGDLILWEHLGMMGREDYRRGWEWKTKWYNDNGFEEGKNLFSSQEDDRGLDSVELTKVAARIKTMLA